MNWTSILTALVLAVASAYLVLFYQWQPWEAFGTMGTAALILIAGLTLLLFAMTPRNQRQFLFAEIWRTMRNDLRKFIDLMRLRR